VISDLSASDLFPYVRLDDFKLDSNSSEKQEIKQPVQIQLLTGLKVVKIDPPYVAVSLSSGTVAIKKMSPISRKSLNRG
jgi:hypothetical protein